MADKKGILTKEQEIILAEMLDEKIKFSNGLLEAIDKQVFKSIITLVDDYGLDRLEEKYKDKADALAELLFAENWAGALVVVWELATLIIAEEIKKE